MHEETPQTNELTLEQMIENSMKSALAPDKIQAEIDKRINDLVKDVIFHTLTWGKARKEIEARIDGLILSAIERYDLDACNVKLDILKRLHLLSSTPRPNETITFQEIFDRWCKIVAEDIDCNDRDTEEGRYKGADCVAELNDLDHMKGSIFYYRQLTMGLEDESDEVAKPFAIDVVLTRYHRDDYWTIEPQQPTTLDGIRHMNRAQIMISAMANARIHIEDTNESYFEEYVIPEEEPEY